MLLGYWHTHTHTKAEKTVTTFAFSSLSILYCTVHRKKNIGENWIFNEYLLMGWITSRISLRCQQYMTFTSPHQKIFIENSIQFSDSVFFSPNASFAETLVSFAAFLVLEVHKYQYSDTDLSSQVKTATFGYNNFF